MTLSALVSAALLLRARRGSMLVMSREEEAASKSDAVHARGPTDAPVVLEEFGDFQCPPCAGISEPINQLEREFRPRLRVIFRQLPLAAHAHAQQAAYAAEAAGLQRRFWELHDLLYREQANWSRLSDVQRLFEGYAGSIGLDVPRLRRDMAGAEVRARVALDLERAAELGVKTTPTVFVNGVTVAPGGIERLRAAIETALKAAPAH